MFRGKPKNKSYLSQLLDSVEKPPLVVYILLVMLAILLDTLKVIGHIICSLLVIVLASAIVISIIVFNKVKPEYDKYMKKGKEIVEASTEDTFRFNETTVIYDKSGKVISSISEDRDTVYLEYDEIPQDVINAFVAIEDRSFWTNSGIDIKGIGRVCVDAIQTKGEEVHGASTITQQLARNIFLSSDVNLDRKLTEMAVALELTKKYSKEQIMEFYVNNIYFANGYYGIEAAAEGYFGKQTKDLTLSEICYLCAIPNSPTYYDPRENPDRAKDRRDLILDAMNEIGYISKEDVEKAKAEEYTLCETDGMTGGYDTTYAIDCAVRQFMKLDGFTFQYHFASDDEYNTYQSKYEEEYAKMRQELCRGGYRIYTSIDTSMQNKLQEIADEFVKEKRKSLKMEDFEAAIVLTDKTGQVSAIIGGAGGNNFGFNRGYQAYRQPGSTVKPLVVYTPAIEEGYLPETPVKNVNLKEAQKLLKEAEAHGSVADISQCSGKTVTMRYGLEKSLNGVAYTLMNTLSPQKTVPYLEKMRFTEIIAGDYTLSAALGGLTNGATPVEMTGAYACLANGGSFNEPTCITSIIDRYGKERYKKEAEETIYDETSVETMQDMLLGVAKSGTAASLKWYESSKEPLYCKTGTTDDQKDNWMCGWADDYVMSVWIGCDTPKDISTVGATGAGALYKQSMLAVLDMYKDAKKETEDKEETKQEIISENAELEEFAPEEAETEEEAEESLSEQLPDESGALEGQETRQETAAPENAEGNTAATQEVSQYPTEGGAVAGQENIGSAEPETTPEASMQEAPPEQQVPDTIEDPSSAENAVQETTPAEGTY